MKDALIESFTGFIAAKESGRDLKGVMTLKSAKLILAALQENEALKAQIVALRGKQEPIFLKQIGIGFNPCQGSYKEYVTIDECEYEENPAKHLKLFTSQPEPVAGEGWIKCSERMPEDSQWCAVSTEYGYYVQCWGSEQGWLGDEISIPNCDVTHWMPIPDAPKPESESGIVVKDGAK